MAAIRPAWVAGLNPAHHGFGTGCRRVRQTWRKGAVRGLDEAEKSTILGADPATLFSVVAVAAPVPVLATLGPWAQCARCQEPVMGDHTRRLQGDAVCVPCFEAARVAA